MKSLTLACSSHCRLIRCIESLKRCSSTKTAVPWLVRASSISSRRVLLRNDSVFPSRMTYSRYLSTLTLPFVWGMQSMINAIPTWKILGFVWNLFRNSLKASNLLVLLFSCTLRMVVVLESLQRTMIYLRAEHNLVERSSTAPSTPTSRLYFSTL
jgi:hypothetical protein